MTEHEEPDAPQVMLVRVLDDRLAVPLADLREVLRARPATHVPGTAEWLRGLVTVRGALVPVGDLVRRAGGGEDGPWLLVVERGGRQVAFGVSAVEGVHIVTESLEIASSSLSSLGMTAATLPRRGAVRLQEQASVGATGAPDAVDVLDVAALMEELFEGD